MRSSKSGTQHKSTPHTETDAPLTRERVVAAAEEVLRRFGPDKATVVDVARALGVSHAAVYRHVSTKAELRQLVVRRWVDEILPPLKAIVDSPGPAPKRLKQLFDTLIAHKRRRYAHDPELFAAFRAIAGDAVNVASEHQKDLIALEAAILRAGIKEGAFRPVDPDKTAAALLHATLKFHHPLHAAEWSEPGIDAAFEALWELLMDGLEARRGQ